MSSILETKKALENYLNTQWTLTPIKWPNVPFQARKDSAGNSLPFIAFLFREIENPGGGSITLGTPNAWYRWVGLVVCQVCIPENYSDAGYAVRLCGLLVDLWRMRDIVYTDSNALPGVIRLRVPSSTEIGIVDGWYYWNVTTSYIRDARS